MIAQSAPTVCGWLRSTGALCLTTRAAPDAYCPEHEQDSTCEGCGDRAHRSCAQFLFKARCDAPLCETCEHKDGAMHGPIVSAAKQAHDTLVTTAELSIADAVSQGLLILPPGGTERPAAELLIKHLAAHVLLQIMSGVANPDDDTSGRR